MTQAIIRAAFETRLDAWATANGLTVAWENRAFSPPATAYARAKLLPARTDDLFFDGTGRDASGLFEVALYMPLGGGPGAGEALVASLDAAFAVSFTQSGLRVTLLTPMSAAAGVQVANRFVIPVSAEYRVVSV
jgi:hypothetical protein